MKNIPNSHPPISPLLNCNLPLGKTLFKESFTCIFAVGEDNKKERVFQSFGNRFSGMQKLLFLKQNEENNMIISYDEFAKVDLRSGTIVKAEIFPRTKKPAYKVWVDFGDEIGIKQTSAQIQFITPQNL